MTGERPGQPGDEADVALLRDYLSASHKVAQRLAHSLSRVAPLLPMTADRIEALSADDEERFDALLHRFASLTAMVQDHVGRAVLRAEEEEVSGSRKDQRLLLEKLGAIDPKFGFGTLAELRNRISHHYPDDPARQAEIVNLVVSRSRDLLAGYNGLAAYADARIFREPSGTQPVVIPNA